MDLNTTKRTSYIEHKVEVPVMHHGTKPEEKFLPFSGTSSYRVLFLERSLPVFLRPNGRGND